MPQLSADARNRSWLGANVALGASHLSEGGLARHTVAEMDRGLPIVTSTGDGSRPAVLPP